MNPWVRHCLRVLLVMLFLGVLLAQAVIIPALASSQGEEFPEVRHLVVPYTIAAILALACVEVALVAIWRLLSMVGDGRIYTLGALRWVDVLTGCAAVATLLSLVVLIDLVGVEQTGGPGPFLLLVACVAAGLALMLLVGVLRGLLRTAIADRDELAEVI